MSGNPEGVRVADQEGVLPLHLACGFASLEVVKLLVEIDGETLNICDASRDYPLHYACFTGNGEVVTYLLEKQVASVSERNVDDMLPIHLLCSIQETLLYLETIWRLLLAYLETVGDENVQKANETKESETAVIGNKKGGIKEPETAVIEDSRVTNKKSSVGHAMKRQKAKLNETKDPKTVVNENSRETNGE